MTTPHTTSLRLLFVSVLLLGFCTATPLFALEDTVRPKAPGFRTDLGLSFGISGYSCVSGGALNTECKGNGVGWGTGGGFTVGLQVRPFRFFSVGLDLSLMNLRPMKDSDWDGIYTRLLDLSVGPVFAAHVPVRIKNVLLEPIIGLKVGFVRGYMPIKDGVKIYKYQATSTDVSVLEAYGEEPTPPANPTSYKHYGPELAGIIGFDVYLLPGFGFGLELRLVATMYQETCEHYDEYDLCSGIHDFDASGEDTTWDGNRTPFKLAYGLRIMKYF